MICIIDYGVGNLFSLKSSLAHLGLEAKVSADPADTRAADRLILPGVGAFADAMAKRKRRKSPCWASASGCSFFSRKVTNTASMRVWASCPDRSARWNLT